MQAVSAATNAADPYRAGLELGSALEDMHPEVVFLFSTVQYEGSPELLEGIAEGVDNEDVLIIGNSGDGYYETSGASENGAAALGLNSGGEVRWHVAHASGVGANPPGATRKVLEDVKNALGPDKPAFVVLFSDFRADASAIEKVIGEEADFPVMGGFAADDSQLERCFLYANGEALSDAVVALGATGPVRFSIDIGNSIAPVGKPGLIDAAEGSAVMQIEGMTAMEFVSRETGKPVLQTDRNITCLSILDNDEPGIKRLRSINSKYDESEGHLGLYGGIEAGKRVQVCLANPEELINEVAGIAQRVKDSEFDPAAGIIVSCAGRKGVLGGEVGHEVTAVTERFGDSLALAGFPSFGEMGPLKNPSGYTRNLFHNMTYVLLLIGK